jgi:hypothetical protein
MSQSNPFHLLQIQQNQPIVVGNVLLQQILLHAPLAQVLEDPFPELEEFNLDGDDNINDASIADNNRVLVAEHIEQNDAIN